MVGETLTSFHNLLNRKLFFYFLFLGLFSACSEKEPEAEKASATAKPDPTRFTSEVVVDGLNESLQLEFDDQNHVYWIERPGFVKRINEVSGEIEVLAEMPVAFNPAPGLIGILLGKNFSETGYIYLYYTAAEDEGESIRLSRFTLGPDKKINLNSEEILLRVPWQYPDSSHFGGGMTWDAAGNLYLSVGGDSQATQYSPLPFTNEGGRGQDAARTAGNTNDLRGSILRIHPEPDGSYTIPEGNLFPKDTPKTRAEIFVMGNRNPWRLSIDSETGYLHWGEVGPDAGVDSEEKGPMGYDEFNVAREAGNYGWPFLIGKNRPYNRYDWGDKNYTDIYDPEIPINDSPNNTGLRKLPPARPALIAYPYQTSDKWPLLGSAGRSAVGGPVFRRADFAPDAPRLFPDYYEGKWLVTDYVRNWIMAISMNEERTKVASIEPLLLTDELSHKQPLDMDFGPSGDLYIVEYGTGNQGRLSKIKYNSGNRAPVASATAKPLTGATPLQVQLSADGSVDYDEDDLDYEWLVKPIADGEAEIYSEQDPVVTVEQPGEYQAILRVVDPSGATASDTLRLLAGNERPEVDLDIVKGNSSFYFPNETIQYKVEVNDAEDGTLEEGNIAADEVSVTVEYIPSGLTQENLSIIEANDKIDPDTQVRHLKAQALLTENSCFNCHKVDEPLVGPSFMDIAERYKGDVAVYEKLSQSIMEGSSGKWEGNIPMPPHPMFTAAETQPIIDYIMNLSVSEEGKKLLPVRGEFKTLAYEPPEASGSRLARFYSPEYEMGSYLLHASYIDEGNKTVEGLELTGDDTVLLRYPLLAPETADIIPAEGISYTPSTNDPGFIFTGQGSYIGFKDIDLTDVSQVKIGAITRFWHWSHFIGATIELRLGSPDGEMIGEPYKRIPPETSEGDGPFFNDAWAAPIPIDVSEVNGIHDVYIVVRNENAEDSDALLIMTGIGFEQ